VTVEAAHPHPEPGRLPVHKIRDHAGVLFLSSSRACAGWPFQIPWCWVLPALVLSQLLLITIPAQGYALLMVSILLEACSTAVVSPLRICMMTVRTVDPKRTRPDPVHSIYGHHPADFPFGWIGGVPLAGQQEICLFILNIGLFVVGGLLAYLAGEASQKRERRPRSKRNLPLP